MARASSLYPSMTLLQQSICCLVLQASALSQCSTAQLPSRPDRQQRRLTYFITSFLTFLLFIRPPTTKQKYKSNFRTSCYHTKHHRAKTPTTDIALVSVVNLEFTDGHMRYHWETPSVRVLTMRLTRRTRLTRRRVSLQQDR